MSSVWDEPLPLAIDGDPFPPHPDTDPALEPAPEKWTERRVLDALEDHFTRATGGNGERYVFARHVRTAAGFDATRTVDAVVVDLWPSKGNLLHALEVKVSRADWLRELRDPSKAAAAVHEGRADTFSVVAPEGVVRRDELPRGWGHYIVEAGTRVDPAKWVDAGEWVQGETYAVDVVRTIRRPTRLAPRLTTGASSSLLDRSYVVALLRATARTAKDTR